MKQALTLSLALAVVCASAAGILAFAEHKTAPARARAQARQQSESMAQVLPPFSNTPAAEPIAVNIATGTVYFYPARNAAGQIIAYAGEGTSTAGYGGELRVLVGLTPAGDVLAVVVSAHSETPGLGTQVTDRQRQQTLGAILRRTPQPDADALAPNLYLDQFQRYNLVNDAPLRMAADGGAIQAVSGATVSSRAVSEAVNQVANAFAQLQAENQQ